MIIIGIDPGKKGGIATLVDGAICNVYPMPLGGNEIDVKKLGWYISSVQPDCAVWIEKLHPMPKNGSISAFRLGENYGTIKAIVRAMGVSLFEVPPQTWKKVILSGTDKSKAAAIDFCLKTWPGVNLLPTERSRMPSDGMADALCIALFGLQEWRKYNG